MGGEGSVTTTSERMTPAQKAIWGVVVACIVALIVIRSLFGHGMGKVYVEPEEKQFVQLSVAPAPEWAPASSEAGTAFLKTNPDANVVGWTEYSQVAPKQYFAQQQAGGGPIILSWPRTIGLWIAGFFTLAIFSFLYRDNPFYKFAESVVVGVSAAYWMVVGFWDTIIPNLVQRLLPAFSKAYFTPGIPLPEGWGEYWPNLFYLIPLVLGIMLICRLLPKVGWISLWPLAFIVGTTAGLRMVGYIEGDLLSQIKATVVPLYVDGSDTSTLFMHVWTTIWGSVAQVLLVVGVLCCLVYFFFSLEHKGAVGGAARVGIWYLMITFGAAFGFTVMGRIALLAARLEFLFDDWFWIIDPTDQRSMAATAISLLM